MATTTIRADIEIRGGAEGAPPRLQGVLMRYGATGMGGTEKFAAGALEWPTDGIRIDADHGSSPARGAAQIPLLRTVPVVSDDGAEVRIDAPLPDTSACRDLAVLMRSDPPLYRAMSVEFRAKRSTYSNGVRTITKAQLLGAALTSNPLYEDTSVEVRADDQPTRRRVWL